MALTRAQISRRYKQRHKAKVAERLRSWRARNPDKVRVYNQHGHRKAKYGLTRKQFETLLLQQHNTCALCSISFTEAKLTVDHNHITGRVRALLCQSCNTMLGQSGDSPARLRAAAAYLEAR
jgi:hypothetical protein